MIDAEKIVDEAIASYDNVEAAIEAQGVDVPDGTHTLEYGNLVEQGHKESYDTGYAEGHSEGHSEGYNVGYSKGHNEGYDEGCEAGAKSEYDKFWDTIQQNGNRKNYQAAGFHYMTAETFRPKYDIRPTSMQYMFYNNGWQGTLFIPDFVEHCKECGIVFDTSKCLGFSNSLGLLKTRRLGVIDFSSVSEANQNNNIWYGNNGYLQTIDELVMSETTTLGSNAFQYATGLINMNVTGVIGKNNFNVSYCTQLTKESLMSIINCLKDYSTYTGSTVWKVTLGSTNLAKLTDDEKDIAYEKGWQLA